MVSEASGQRNVIVGPNQEMQSFAKTLEKTVSEMRKGLTERGGNKPSDPEGVSKSHVVGQVIGNVLMGPKGFGEKGGMKDQMKNMATSMIPMGNAMKTGGAMGVGLAAVGGIFGIVKQALGSSSIFQGVIAQFFKIAGYMMDMILMPLLPYFMKFLQWMMNSVMPVVMRVSEAVGELLKGNAAPLVGAIFSGLVKMAWWSITSFWPTVIKMLAKGLASLFSPSNWFGGGNKGGSGGGMGSGAQAFGKNVEDSAGGALGDLKSFADRDKAKNTAWWRGWGNRMYGTSILPDVQDEVMGFFSNIGDKAGDAKEGLAGWISGLGNWLGGIWDGMKDIFWSIVHGVKGFFTGKDAEGKPVEHSIPGYVGKAVDGVTSGISTMVMNLGDLWGTIWGKVKTMWGEWKSGGGGIRGWIYDNTLGRIPSWGGEDGIQSKLVGLGGALFAFGDEIKDWFGDAWNKASTWVIDNTVGRLPSWTDIQDKFEDIGGGLLDLGSSIWGWLMGTEGHFGEPGTKGIFEKMKDWVVSNTVGKLPSWSDVTKKFKETAVNLFNLGEDIGEWFRDTWGSWGDRTGIVGWVREHTLDLLPSMDDIKQTALGMLPSGMVNKTWEEVGGGDVSIDPGGTWEEVLSLKSIGDMFSGLGDWIGDNLNNLWDLLTGWIPSFNISWPDFSWIKDIPSKLMSNIADVVWDAVMGEGILSQGLNWVLTHVPGLKGLKDWAEKNRSANQMSGSSGLEPGGGGSGSGGNYMWKTGGFVPGAKGEAVFGMLHGGEYVVPAHLASGNSYMNSMVNGTSPAGQSYVDQKNFNINITSNWAPSDLVNDLAKITDLNTTSYLNTVGA